MTPLRNLIRRPWLRVLLCLALAMRVLTPVGAMAGTANDGGLTFKLCTAAGLQTVVLPAENAGDVDNLPEYMQNRVQIVYVTDIQEVLAAALVKAAARGPKTEQD